MNCEGCIYGAMSVEMGRTELLRFVAGRECKKRILHMHERENSVRKGFIWELGDIANRTKNKNQNKSNRNKIW